MLIHGRRLLKVGFWEAGLTWSFNTRSREPWPRHRILSEGGPVYVCSSRGHGVRSGHGRSQPGGLVARDGASLDPPRRDARELISRKIPRARDESAELNRNGHAPWSGINRGPGMPTCSFNGVPKTSTDTSDPWSFPILSTWPNLSFVRLGVASLVGRHLRIRGR